MDSSPVGFLQLENKILKQALDIEFELKLWLITSVFFEVHASEYETLMHFLLLVLIKQKQVFTRAQVSVASEATKTLGSSDKQEIKLTALFATHSWHHVKWIG